MFNSEIGIKGNGIILRHVLEHIQEPLTFLSSLSHTNNGGLIYIEVPCFDWILKNNAWFDIFYEHVNYFRLSDFKQLFTQTIKSGHLFGGQYMYVVAELSTLRNHLMKTNFKPLSLPKNFSNSLLPVINYLKKRKGKLVIWGGASKGVIFSLYAIREGLNIDYVVDINPAKQGKYLAITGLKVYAPQYIKSDKEITDVVIMNSNYSDEIKASFGDDYNYLTVDNNEF